MFSQKGSGVEKSLSEQLKAGVGVRMWGGEGSYGQDGGDKSRTDKDQETNLANDEYQLWEGEESFKINMGGEFDESTVTEIAAQASLHILGCHFHMQWFGKDFADTVLSAVQGKKDVIGDENWQ